MKWIGSFGWDKKGFVFGFLGKTYQLNKNNKKIFF
jgi:hypothetical protein